jgi:predicted nucleotidyltransferase component of viral defense system
MVDGPKHIAASVKDRLLALAKAQGRVFDEVLVRYALERLLYRLSVSEYRERFILKGGLLVTIWIGDDNRVTRDADFLGFGDGDEVSLKTVFTEIMAINTDDGLVFDLDALLATPIREEMEYGGVRLKTSAFLAKTRIAVTIDIGFGDAVALGQIQTITIPTLLDSPVPKIRAYPPAAVIAEKFHAIVALGVINGRMKDYHDLWVVPTMIPFSGADLDAALEATFARRQTDIPKSRPPGLDEGFYGDPTKQRQWRAYSDGIGLAEIELSGVCDEIWRYLKRSCDELGNGS